VKLTKYCGKIDPTSNCSFGFSNVYVTWEMRQYKKFIQKFYAHLYDLIGTSLHVENFDFYICIFNERVYELSIIHGKSNYIFQLM
jgi:hypothetical protein